MRLIAISDTHGRHKKLQVPEGDILAVCGDITPKGDLGDLRSFAKWIGKLDFPHKVVIAGNHDWCFENDYRFEAPSILREFGCHYLQDEGIQIGEYLFYGSPWQPEFCNWAFNLRRGEPLLRVWNQIPEETDVLITHGPPLGILDRVGADHVGCKDLRDTIFRIRPKVHLFGHIHSGHGEMDIEGVRFGNASVLNEAYRIEYPPIVIEL